VFSFCSVLVSVLNLFSVLYFPACSYVSGTVEPNFADVPLRIYSFRTRGTNLDLDRTYWAFVSSLIFFCF